MCLALAVMASQVSVARPSSKDIKNSKLYVTNLPDHFSQDQVVEVFEQVRACVFTVCSVGDDGVRGVS